ncbi:hypothetical protein RFI_22290, partial [Reticulomyxa filosa]
MDWYELFFKKKGGGDYQLNKMQKCKKKFEFTDLNTVEEVGDNAKKKNWYREIYIHPNLEPKGSRMALTVLPIRSSGNESDLPDHYRVRYSVTAHAVSSNPKREQTLCTKPYKWERELGQIPPELDEKAVARALEGDRRQARSMSASEWNVEDEQARQRQCDPNFVQAFAEPLPFTAEELRKDGCIEVEGHFKVLRLFVEIRCTFIRKKDIESKYFGVLGALL